MSLSGGSPPTPANPNVVAQQQEKFNLKDAIATQAGSQVNQFNPYGSLTYEQQKDASGKPITGPSGVPLYTATTKLSPAQQQLLDVLQKSQFQAGNIGNKMLDNYTGNTDPTKAIGDKTSGLTQQMMDSWYGANSRSLNDAKDQMDTKLKNQGLFPGSPGYDKAMMNLVKGEGEARNSFLASAQPQAFSEASSLYQMPASLGGALAAFGKPESMNQSLVQTPGLNVASPDLIGANANYNTAMSNNYAQQIAQQDAMMAALGNIGGMALGGWASGGLGGKPWSDRRLKRDITPIGELDNGLAIYAFRYVWDDVPRIGLMADEVERIHPEAVEETGGYKTVNYELAIR